MNEYHVFYTEDYENCRDLFKYEEEMLKWVNNFKEENHDKSGSVIQIIVYGRAVELESKEVKTKYVVKR